MKVLRIIDYLVIFRIIVPGIRGVSYRKKERDKKTSFRAVYFLLLRNTKTVLICQLIPV
jgi:hypothetical protein